MKKYLRIFFFLIITFTNILNVKAISYIGAGVGAGQSSSDCPGGSTKWCQWNNRRHVTVEVQLYHYNGKDSGDRDQISRSVIFTTNPDFVKISGAIVKKFDSSFKGSRDNDAKSFPISDLRNYFTTKKTLGITLHYLLPSLDYDSSNPGLAVTTFSNWAKGKYSVLYRNNYHEPAVGDYGFRIVVRPIVSFIKTKTGEIEFMDAGGELSCYKDSKCNFYNDKYYNEFPCYMFINKDDVKYKSKTTCTKVDVSNTTLVNNIINEKSYIGLNIVDLNATLTPDTRCNPDANYSGTAGVSYCCNLKTIKLTYMNYSSNVNNTTKNLTRVIKKDELKGTVCDDRCNTSNAEGIKNCCVKYNMTATANTKYNTETYLTKIISTTDLKKYCPSKCNKDTKAQIKECCNTYNITYINQTNNVNSLFSDNIKLTNAQLLENCDDRCNTNNKDGVQKCCTSLGIKYSNVDISTKNDEKYITKKIDTKDLEGTTCDDRCNPDKVGIKECCEKNGITYKNQTNNTLKKLTRLLSSDELLNKCDTRCNTNSINGIKNCCNLHNITYLNRINNNTNILTKVISDDDLYKYCDDRCDSTSPSGIKHCCEKHSISVDNVKNNNKDVLKEIISDSDLVRYCNPYAEKRCNPNTEGIKVCCDKANITTDNKTNNTTEYLTEILTDKQINDNCYIDTCDYNINSQLPSNCEDSTVGGIYDNNSWKCIFKSSRSNDDKIRNTYISSIRTNPFCALYCKSDVKFSFPLPGTITYQGRYLTVNYRDEYNINNVISPLESISNTTCRTSGGEGDISGYIDINRFNKALKYTNDNIKKFFNLWKDKKTNALKLMYEQSIIERDNIISKINDCQNMLNDYKEDINPKLSIEYNDPKEIYTGIYTLYNNNIESKKEFKTYIGGSSENGSYDKELPFNNGNIININKVTCSDNNGCNNTVEVKIHANSWYEGIYKTSSNYVLNPNLFRYVSKTNTQSYTSKPLVNEEYIDIGHGTLPIHYSTLPGKYNYKINLNSIGSDKLSNLGDFKTTYNCSYEISCEKIVMINDCKSFCNSCEGWCKKYSCESGNISAIYRPISLYEGQSFLNKNGEERKPGIDWIVTDYMKNFIYNNRGVENYEVYNQSPVYEITLNPSLIKEIRKYNEAMNKKESTIYEGTSIEQKGIAGYSSYEDINCKNGRNCISQKIREWGATGCGINNNNYNKCNNIEIYK